MQLRELKTGDWFTFANREIGATDPYSGAYEYRGNCWYGKPYSGGPFHQSGDTTVFLCDMEHTAHCRMKAESVIRDEDERWARNRGN